LDELETVASMWAYLPEFRDARVLEGATVQDPLTVPVDKAMTIQHLFTHTSGLIYDASGELIDEFIVRGPAAATPLRGKNW